MANRSSRRTQSTQSWLSSAVSAVIVIRSGTPSPLNKNRISAAFAAFALIVGGQAVLAQPDRARTEALARRATERLQALQREADRLAAHESTLLGDLRKLEIERQLRAEELKRLDADAAKIGV